MLRASDLSSNKILIFLLLLTAAYYGLRDVEVRQPTGMLVYSEPTQKEIKTNEKKIYVGAYSLEKLAEYEITGRVLGRSRYFFDPGAKLAPYDLALGWRRMSDSQFLKDLSISQGQRFLYFQWPEDFELTEAEVFDFSSNNHIIPANVSIQSEVRNLRIGQVVTLKGFLVQAFLDGQMVWKSSLTRSDRGAGACELMYVTSIKKN